MICQKVIDLNTFVNILLQVFTSDKIVSPATESDDVLQEPGRRLHDHEVFVQLSRDSRGRQHSPGHAPSCSHVHLLQPQLRHQQVEQQLHT